MMAMPRIRIVRRRHLWRLIRHGAMRPLEIVLRSTSSPRAQVLLDDHGNRISWSLQFAQQQRRR
jgi:hypothetical protein